MGVKHRANCVLGNVVRFKCLSFKESQMKIKITQTLIHDCKDVRNTDKICSAYKIKQFFFSPVILISNLSNKCHYNEATETFHEHLSRHSLLCISNQSYICHVQHISCNQCSAISWL